MTAQYPSSIISFPIRVNGQVIDAGDVNMPDAEITAIENFVGTQSSTFGMTYDLRSPSSDGGGHVQSATKGGTGQTQYNKGDLLVGQSNSVLGKQAAGPDNYAIVYDSNQTNGLRADAVATEANIRNQSPTYAVASVLSASVYGITFPNIVSVLQAGQAFQVKWPNSPTTSVLALQVSSLLAQRIVNPDLTNPDVGSITSSMISILENDGVNFQFSSRQKGGSTIYKNGVSSRADTVTSGSQTIPHGSGITPKVVRINCTYGGGTGFAAFSSGTYNGSTTATTWFAYKQTTTGTDTTNMIYMFQNAAGTGGNQAATISVDATNITLTWTLTGGFGAANGTFMNFSWETEA